MDNFYPLTLYRDGSEIVWDGRGTDLLTVADKDEHDAALAEGWAEAADYLASDEPGEPSLLDGSAKDIKDALPDLSLEDLEALKAAETEGKTRSTVLAAIDAAIDAKLKG